VTERLIAVTKASLRESSLRITLPKENAEILNVDEKDHIGFYFNQEEVIVRKID
jgi:bifunctional DNA-binding transcriptional regulator/antitoxin component of YhaV-PrlF toxin-antitoxin module